MPRFPYQQRTLSTDDRVRDLLARMSLRQQLGQLVQADGRQRAEEQVRTERAGSFLHLLGEPTIELQRLAEQVGFGIPLIFGIDAIHGHGFWPGASVFPTQLALSCSWDPERMRDMGRVTAREMAVTGMHWTFSPVLCITRDLRWGRVGETFGEDAYLIGELGAALVEGYQGSDLAAPDSVLACAKHYAGYSETVGGKDATEADLSKRKLRATFLPPFQRVARAGCRTFMTAYQCIDGVSCVVNRWLLTDLLRDEWGFEGFVVTDWNNVGRTVTQQRLYPNIDEATPPSLKAGNDMIMCTPDFYDAALRAVERGALVGADIEEACRRVLTQKFALGLFDDKRYPEFDRVPEVVGCDEHRVALSAAAAASLVLLKNGPSQPGNEPILPLGSGIRRIALLGANADDPLAQLGDWSFGSGQADFETGGHPRTSIVTVRDAMAKACHERGLTLDYVRGCDVLKDDRSELAAAAQIASDADVAIVVLGDTLELIGEECDRSDLDLSGSQLPLIQTLLETGTPVIAVLINSKPLCLGPVADAACAILEAFNPGMCGGTAIADALFGELNPSGKLTVSFPKTVGALPVYYQQIPGWHGNKHLSYDDSPLYPFGFGLSYTRFQYDHLCLSSVETTDPDAPALTRRSGSAPAPRRVDSAAAARLRVSHEALGEIRLSVRVTNVGERAGTEITQLYLRDLYTTLSTPDRLLKRFARTHLEPGESATLHFSLQGEDLSFPGPDGLARIELGTFEVLVGGSSDESDLLVSSFELVD